MSEQSAEEFLGVRDAARLLGVHENTVRNWARDGVLPSQRIPGSRFHRFDPKDVERLAQERTSVVSSGETQRRTIGPELVDGTQLSAWADSHEAQAIFPQLMRRLLASVGGVTNISVRSGDGVLVPGWDGSAESTGASYLPTGALRFEFGVGRNPRAKASSDYEGRRSSLDPAEASALTFVFATPRRWYGAAKWAAERRAERFFADVRVLDADDLEGWLHQSAAVHRWISEQLGRRPQDAETLERWWARFRGQTEPELPAALFLAGRESDCADVARLLADPAASFAIKAASPMEATAFLFAAIDSLGEDAGDLLNSCLVVRSADAWSRLADQPGHLTLVRLVGDPADCINESAGHRVIVPVGPDQTPTGTTIGLRRLGREPAREALQAAGLAHSDADRLSGLARRSMPSLIRQLSRDPVFANPVWSGYPDVEIIAPLILMGAWRAIEGDTTTVSRVVNRPWVEVERTLERLAATPDPPFVRTGTEWRLAAPEEAFLLLHGRLTASAMSSWKGAAANVLLERDPSLDLPSDERYLAGARGLARDHSTTLRAGIADSIALLGSLGQREVADGTTAEHHARELVWTILQAAGADVTGETWTSLSYELPRLAEAAAQTFLDAIHRDLDGDPPVLRHLFQDGGDSSPLTSSSAHTHLLWALETVCWSPDHVVEGTQALARLQRLDPGGRLANRPLRSLESVLVGWVRHTSAPLDTKVRALESICRTDDRIAWPLLLELWPSHHGTSWPPSLPRFRDWRPESETVPLNEWLSYVGHLVRLALETVGLSAERWADMAEHISALPPHDRDRVLDALNAIADGTSLSDNERTSLWRRLRKDIDRHKRHASAGWSLDPKSLQRLDAVADRMKPAACSERCAYLFDWHPDLPDVRIDDFHAYEKEISRLREEAAATVLDAESLDGLRIMAKRCAAPSILGRTVGVVGGDALAPSLLPWLDSDDPIEREVAASWAEERLHHGGVPLMLEMLAITPTMDAPSRRLALVKRAPPSAAVWDSISRVDQALSDGYWETANPSFPPPEDIDRAANELVAHGRPWAAVDVLAFALHSKDRVPAVSPEVVNATLDAVVTATASESAHMPAYEIGRLLDFLERSGASDHRLGQHEFAFFELLQNHRNPKALFRVLGEETTTFISLVKAVYRGKEEPPRRLNKEQEAFASHAWSVLRHWDRVPGLRGDGSIDAEHLKRWVTDARLALAEVNRADIGDEVIGQILASGPAGSDGVPLNEAVREIVETIGSSNLESGVYLGIVNARGVSTRGVFDGGERERTDADRYRKWARETAGTWRRTSRILRRVAESYERDADREDRRVDLLSDRD